MTYWGPTEKQHRQCMYNVTLSSVRVATVVVQMTADYVYPKCTVVGGDEDTSVLEPGTVQTGTQVSSIRRSFLTPCSWTTLKMETALYIVSHP